MRVRCADCEVIYDNEFKAQCPRCRSHVYTILTDKENDLMSSTAKQFGKMTDAEYAAWEKLAQQEINGMSDVSDSDIPKDSETSGTPDAPDTDATKAPSTQDGPNTPKQSTFLDTNAAWDKWYPQGTGKVTSFCTHKPQEVIHGKTWKVFAGSRYDCKRHLAKYPVILNLSGTSSVAQHSIPIPSLRKWETVASREIMLDWNDGSDIDLPIQFWIELREYLAETKQNMLIFCMGGHGRTGTAIAALLISSGWKAKAAIEWIRKNYCHEAIETKVQEWYLEDLEEEYIELLADSGLLEQAAKSDKSDKSKKSKNDKGKK